MPNEVLGKVLAHNLETIVHKAIVKELGRTPVMPL